MSRTSTFTARPGGVTTREVGTITGRIELETGEQDGVVVARAIVSHRRAQTAATRARLTGCR